MNHVLKNNLIWIQMIFNADEKDSCFVVITCVFHVLNSLLELETAVLSTSKIEDILKHWRLGHYWIQADSGLVCNNCDFIAFSYLLLFCKFQNTVISSMWLLGRKICQQ